MDQTAHCDFDEHLKQLATSAQRHPPLTPERQLALRQLVNSIFKSGQLCRPQQGDFPGIYEDIYDEAVQELLLYVCQNIDKYDPEQGTVMTWVNVLLRRRFFKDAAAKFLAEKHLKRLSLADIDCLPSPEEPLTLTASLEEYINADPENLFKGTYIKENPAANFQVLAKRRFAGMGWKDISVEFGVSISTASSFYYRCLNKFSAKLKDHYFGTATATNLVSR